MSDRDGIQKLGPQHYRVWWVELGSGKRRSRVVRDTLEQAKKVRAAIVDSQTRREYVSPSTLTLERYLRGWLDDHELRGETARSTHERYRSLLLGSVLERLGTIPLQDLSERQIDDYYLWALRRERTARGTLVSRETVRKRHRVLRKALGDAVRKRLIVRNPTDYATPPKQSSSHGQALTRDGATALLGALDGHRLELPVRIALFTGMRLGEVLGLTWRHVDLPESGPGRLTIAGIVSETRNRLELAPYAKTKHSRRTITMDAELADALRRHRTQQVQERLALGPAWQQLDLVCCRFDGGIWRPSRLSLDFTPIARMLEDEGVLSTRGATFHTLRHTHATLMLAAGVPVHVVSRRLGHSKIQITLDFYAHVIPGQDEDAAGAFADLIAGREDSTMHTECTSEGISEPVLAVQ